MFTGFQLPNTATKHSRQGSEGSQDRQNNPQAMLRQKLQAIKQRRGTLTSLSSSNQSDNQSTNTDDANELYELQRYFEGHHQWLGARLPTARPIEVQIIRTIKSLGEAHYLPV